MANEIQLLGNTWRFWFDKHEYNTFNWYSIGIGLTIHVQNNYISISTSWSFRLTQL